MSNSIEIGKKTLRFPVKTDIKIIMDNSLSQEDAKMEIEKACGKSKIYSTGFSVKESSGGKFKSYSINVILKNRNSMEALYADLGAISGIKMVL